MLTAIFLHGALGEKYGERLSLDVDSVAQAIALLRANFAEFARDVIGQGNRYRVWVGKTNIGRRELGNPTKGQDIHIVPVVSGSGGGDFPVPWKKSNAAGFLIGPHLFPADSQMGQVVRVIVGVVLIVVGIIFWEFGGLAWGVSPGIGLVIGGISDYLTFSSLKKLRLEHSERGAEKRSAYFNGPVNTVGQGNPVPILYGRLRVGSQVVSGGLSDQDVA